MLFRPDGPRPVVDGSNTTVQDLTDDFLAIRDALVRISDRCKSADETQIEAEYRAVLLLSSKAADAYEAAAKRLRKDFSNTVRAERDKWKQDRRDRRITRVLQP